MTLYLAAELFGLGCAALGGYELIMRHIGSSHGFFASTAEAFTCMAGGGAVMAWAAARLMREIRHPSSPRDATASDAENTKMDRTRDLP